MACSTQSLNSIIALSSQILEAPALEIVVLDKQSNKLFRIDVQPKHTIGSIIETIVDHQKMNKNWTYRLSVGNRSFGKENYLIKLQDAGIGHGDHIFLEVEPPARFCVKCRKALRPGTKFCVACGAPTRTR